MTELQTVRDAAAAALASLEANRRRIDDLNVYPVPDGDTGTNLTLTLRELVESLEASEADDRAALARDVTRGALMGARGNSGVIFSQIVRGAADVLGAAEQIDAVTLAQALRGASDAAYRAVRRPVEGTMLTVIRELAEEAEARAQEDPPVAELAVAVVRRGEESVARTQELLDVLREAGVVDAGGAGLLEIVRGIAAWITGEPLPAAVPHEELGIDAIHQELSRYRYCTVFMLEGEDLDLEALEGRLDALGDSLLVVGDRTALKVHLHTDDPGAALSLGSSLGVLEAIEVANMHRQTAAREERLLEAVPDPGGTNASDVVAVVVGEGNRRLFESLGAARVIEGGQTMNPSAAELVAAIEEVDAEEVVILPNNSNVVMSAEQAAGLVTRKRVEVVATESIQAGLAAMVAYDGSSGARENSAEMSGAAAAVATGEVTIASRDAALDGLVVRKGHYFGLADGRPVAEGESFDTVARSVVERLLAEPRGLLTFLAGSDRPDLDGLVAWVSEHHPDVELEVQEGGQPHYPLLLSAE
jgi:fatty acid kinase